MLMSSANKKPRVFSVRSTTEEKRLKSKRQAINAAVESTRENKQKRRQRITSVQGNEISSAIKDKIKRKKVEKANKQPADHLLAKSKEQSQVSANPHLLTVADLQSERGINSPAQKRKQASPVQAQKQFSTIKTQEAGVQANKGRVTLPLQLQKNLDQTIQKLKSKQESIDILSRTIQTRLVEAGDSKQGTSKRIDVYQIEINFYVQKISQLQKELYQKNKILNSLTHKNAEFNTVTKNNRKLIGQNHRLKQERQLLERENAALKKLLLKRDERTH